MKIEPTDRRVYFSQWKDHPKKRNVQVFETPVRKVKVYIAPYAKTECLVVESQRRFTFQVGLYKGTKGVAFNQIHYSKSMIPHLIELLKKAL